MLKKRIECPDCRGTGFVGCGCWECGDDVTHCGRCESRGYISKEPKKKVSKKVKERV